MQSVRRMLSLPRSDRHVLGADLNRSESKGWEGRYWTERYPLIVRRLTVITCLIDGEAVTRHSRIRNSIAPVCFRCLHLYDV
jgi:hypothetical protein